MCWQPADCNVAAIGPGRSRTCWPCAREGLGVGGRQSAGLRDGGGVAADDAAGHGAKALEYASADGWMQGSDERGPATPDEKPPGVSCLAALPTPARDKKA